MRSTFSKSEGQAFDWKSFVSRNIKGVGAFFFTATLFFSLGSQLETANAQGNLAMDLISSSAETECYAYAELPNNNIDFDWDSDSGSATPQTSFSQAVAFISASPAYSSVSGDQYSETASVENGTGVEAFTRTTIIDMGAAATTGGTAYGLLESEGKAESVWEIGEYSGSDDTWIEGYIRIEYTDFRSSYNSNASSLAFHGDVRVEGNHVYFGPAPGFGVIWSLGDLYYDFEWSPYVIGEYFSPSTYNSSVTFYFREYVIPGQQIEISVNTYPDSVFDPVEAEIECESAESALLDGTELTVTAYVVARHGTPD